MWCRLALPPSCNQAIEPPRDATAAIYPALQQGGNKLSGRSRDSRLRPDNVNSTGNVPNVLGDVAPQALVGVDGDSGFGGDPGTNSCA